MTPVPLLPSNGGDHAATAAPAGTRLAYTEHGVFLEELDTERSRPERPTVRAQRWPHR